MNYIPAIFYHKLIKSEKNNFKYILHSLGREEKFLLVFFNQEY